ncbi:MAG: C13 family peptidase [Candidatus Thorarchaeota archaeon]
MSKSKKASSRPTGLLVLVLVLIASNAGTVFYFMVLNPSVPTSDVPLNIGDVTGGNAEDYIGKTVTLSGYYIIAADANMLVLNPLFYFNNSLNSGNYVLIGGTVPQSMQSSLGKLCEVKGVLEVADASDGTLRIQYERHVAKESDALYAGNFNDFKMSPYVEFEQIPHILDPTAEKYAVLYSGGIRPDKAYSRYWNDIIYMHFILLMHGYLAENIYVIYKDGVGEDTYTPVDYPATHDSLDTVFGILSEEMGLRDSLFFYTTNHGGSGGISVWDALDPSGALTQTQVDNWLDSITCHHMIIVMEQCVSGKFIQYISAANRVILTACKDDESSYSADTEGNWDEFVYHFMSALVGFPWNSDGSTVDADFNNDSLISMREAFIWAAAMDSRPETPWYNDNGDGVGYNVLQVAFGSGPWYGNNIFL